MTKAELMSFAEDNGIEGVRSSQRKAEMIETIEAAL
jgi:hypothetical protein